MTQPPKKKKRTNSILNYFQLVKSEETDNTNDRKAEEIEMVDMAKEPKQTKKKMADSIAGKCRVHDSCHREVTNSIAHGYTNSANYYQDGEKASTSGAEGSMMAYPSDSESTSKSQNSTKSERYQDIQTSKPRRRNENCTPWKGIPIHELHSTPECSVNLPVLHNTVSNAVLFKVPYTYSDYTPPTPTPHNAYRDAWDADHVKMPCSHSSEYPVFVKRGKTQLRRRWEIIEEVLLSKIPGPFELEGAILSYNARYADKWNFVAMHYFFTDTLDQKERNYFFETTLEKMVGLALQLPHLCTLPIPLLKKGKQKSITLSQQQIACLLANAFFCTFPRRNAQQRHSEYRDYPTINFNRLFEGQPHIVKMQKMKCIIHYFKRVTSIMPTGTVTFTRQVIDRMPDWDNSDIELRRLHVSSEGTIEDDGRGMLQVDFANKYIGGGVLGKGCVQEEIRFLINPEMIVSRLFTEVLEKNECLIMTGCERYSTYYGYASTFTWSGNYTDHTKRDKWGRLCTEVAAIDALVFKDYSKQFLPNTVKRELDKAYCGFYTSSKSSENISAVCTGNWGCGAFGGDKYLKALIQLMAAAQAKRDVCYLTFDDDILRDDLYKIHNYLSHTNTLDIGTMLQLIEKYRLKKVLKCVRKPKMTLFQYIVGTFDGQMDDTDEEDSDSLELQHWDEIEQQSVEEACGKADWDDEPGDSLTIKDSQKFKMFSEDKDNTH